LNQLNEYLSKDEVEFKRKWSKFSNMWLKCSLVKFHNYFKKQWIDSQFNKWAVFHSPPGYRNNPVESYSKSIKAYFTNNEKMHFIPVFKIFKELIVVESSKLFDYKITVEVNKSQENKSKKLDAAKFCKIEDTQLYEYNHKNGHVSTINFEDKTCTCNCYHDRAICLHLIRVCYFEKLILPGKQIIDKFSIRYRRKCLKKTTEFDEDFSQEEEENDNDNDDSHEVDQAITSSVNI
jgi:hypothetical protein